MSLLSIFGGRYRTLAVIFMAVAVFVSSANMFGLAKAAVAHDHGHHHGHVHHPDSDDGDTDGGGNGDVAAHAHVISILPCISGLPSFEPSSVDSVWIADYAIQADTARLERPPRTTDI